MDDLTGNLGEILKLVAAVGALGTAAFWLVDASKAFWGGLSNPGFGYVHNAVERLLAADAGGAPAFGRDDVMATLKANWLNGLAKADQKATAKALVRLMLSPATADAMARAVGVDGAQLALAAQHVQNNEAITEQDIKVLGVYDVMASAVLDLGYERGDQFYRNVAKAAAAGCAVVLAVAARWINDGSLDTPSLAKAVLVGLVATPMAPMVKDVSTSLSTAVKSMSALRR